MSDEKMIVAVASGKGGTGKTLISTSLVLSLASRGVRRLSFLDCDVEEPNARIFLSPEMAGREDVEVPVPVIDDDACAACGLCAEVCEYNAIMVNRRAGKVFLFPKLCHGCSACRLLCPYGAVSEGKRAIGVLEWGTAGGMEFAEGMMTVGEAMAPPVIRALTGRFQGDGISVRDCPPGTACPAVTAVRGADFCLLVTEPTPFGLNDLSLAVGMVRELGLKAGVVINQSDIADAGVRDYCKNEALTVLAEIPHDRALAEAYSRGVPAIHLGQRYERLFAGLWEAIERDCAR